MRQLENKAYSRYVVGLVSPFVEELVWTAENRVYQTSSPLGEFARES